MTITLGGVTISDDMYLSGLESNSQVSVDQKRTIDGISVVRVQSNPGGRIFTLGSQNRSGAIQGFWEWDIIDQIKDLELAAQSVILNYRGTQYTVYITGTNFEPFLQFEIESSTKKFTGTVSLLEA